MKKVTAFFCCILLLLITSVGAFAAPADYGSADSVKPVIENIISYNLKKSSCDSVQKWLDSTLCREAGASAEWYVMALSRYCRGLDFSGYRSALGKYLENSDVINPSSRLKYALALVACGEKKDPFVTAAANEAIGEQGIMSLIFGLHLLNNAVSSKSYTSSDVVDKILALQCSDGGWSLTSERSDVDVTAMAVQALAGSYHSDKKVKSAVDRAVTCLSKMQASDGSYMSYGVKNPESSAQVLVALSALGINAQKDGRFIKNNCSLIEGILRFKLNDGSFCHSENTGSNETSTVQSFYSLVAFYLSQTGESPLFIFKSKNAPVKVDKTTSVTHSLASTTDKMIVGTTSETTTSETVTLSLTVGNVSESFPTEFSSTKINVSENEASYQVSETKNVSKRIVIILIVAFVLIATAVVVVSVERAKRKKSQKPE